MDQQLARADSLRDLGQPQQAVVYVRVSSSGQLDRDGDEDGYSIPAQIQACMRTAADRGYRVVKVFTERAESARTDGRPALQQMLRELPELNADALIVHKVDRLARSRLDDATLYQRFVGMNVKLISASENIDDTPAGQLMHGMLATFAEYYSNNLAAEVTKGLHQKHANGGTPFKPPIGYLPHRELIAGNDIRSVVVDPDRAPFIRLAFELYATGDWTLLTLADHLEQLGFRSRPTAKLPSKPLGVSMIQKVLVNEYYKGIVKYGGKRVVGRHEPLVSADLFEQVQVTLAAHAKGERASKHDHYLRGTVVCSKCRGRLLFGRHRGKTGKYYEYFSCVNRASRGRSNVLCASRHHRVDLVEQAVEDLYASIRMPADAADEMRTALATFSVEQSSIAQREIDRHRQRIRDIEHRQKKLLDLYYKDLIAESLFESEQAELKSELAGMQSLVETSELVIGESEQQLEEALEFTADPQGAYLAATPTQRRALNRAFWQRIEIDDNDSIAAAEPTKITEVLAPSGAERPDRQISTVAPARP